MSIEKGFENNKLFLESIEAEAIGQSNGILNSAYLAVGYLKTLINSKLLTVDSANKSGISVSKVLATVKKFEEDDIIYFGSTYVNKIITSNIHKEARKVDDCIIPVYMDTILSEMYKLDIEIVKYKFSEVLKGFDILDESICMLLKELDTDVTFIDSFLSKDESNLKSDISKVTTDSKQLTLEDVYNIKLNDKESKNCQKSNVKLQDNKDNSSSSNDIDDYDYCYKPEFIIDMLDEIEDSTEKILDINNYNTKMLNVISRKKQKSICLVGESGIGKTSTAKNFIKYLYNNGINTNKFSSMNIFRVDSTRLICDTSYRGEFELKVTDMLDYFDDLQEENNYKCQIILFLDDLANFCNLGMTDNDTNSFMTMLLPYLSSGEISLISTCNTSLYHKIIENNTQLRNAIQIINMKEPSEEESAQILNYSKQEYENYHDVKLSRSNIKDVVKLSSRYIKHGHFPDKAVKVIDQTLAIACLNNKNKITKRDIIEVISDISEIDIKELTKTDKDRLKELDTLLHKSIISQDNAINKVVKAIKRGKLGISSSEKPIASFLFVGPTGVGKTELTKQLHKCIFNSDKSMLRLDMSEFSEEASISKLIGAAPGYVGYENGGRLTEYVKHNPQSLILLDEIEKANPKIFNSLLQILDCGRLTDNTGYTVDFRDCIIIMTSNAGYGADGLSKSSLGFSTSNSISEEDKKREIEKKVRTALESTFSPEFLNRLDSIVLFNKLSKEDAILITKLELNKLSERLKNNNINIKFSNNLVRYISDKGYSDKYGARNIKREIQDSIEDSVADFMLDDKLSKNKLNILDLDNENKVTIK